MSDQPLLSIQNLSIHYRHGKTDTVAVRNANLTLNAGETVGIVGESGSGKSTLAMSLLGLLPPQESAIPNGKILFKGRSLLDMNGEEWRKIRGKEITMIFQDPFSALNPVLTAGYQLEEAIELEKGRFDKKMALDLFSQVQLADPERVYNSYPHQLSGGQRQRVMIAIAIARRPDLLIADEPTTALDVTIQDEIIKLLLKLQKDLNMAMIFVTHNMGLVKMVSHRVAVMRAGQIVEQGLTEQVLKHPTHPYTQGLLRCIIRLKKTEGPLPVFDSALEM